MNAKNAKTTVWTVLWLVFMFFSCVPEDESGGNNGPNYNVWEKAYAGTSWSGTYTDFSAGTYPLRLTDIKPGKGFHSGSAKAQYFFIGNLETCLNQNWSQQFVWGNSPDEFEFGVFNGGCQPGCASLLFTGIRSGNVIFGSWQSNVAWGNGPCSTYYPVAGSFSLSRL